MEVIPQLVWRWKIGAYLFLAGAGAGAYLVGVMAMFAGYDVPARLAVTVGIPVVAISTLFLIADLGHPKKFFTAMLHPGTSWISRGFYILLAQLAVGGVHVALWVWPFNLLNDASDVRSIIAVIGAICGVATALYTGILIGVIVSRPFWNSPLLPVLFLVSAVSTGIGLVFLATTIWKVLAGQPDQVVVVAILGDLARADIVLILVECLIVYLYLQIAYDRAKEAVNLLIRARFATAFWGGFVGVGLLIPLLLEYVALRLGDPNTEMLLGFVAGIAVLFGGLLLRFMLLGAGVRVPLYVRVPFWVRPGV